MRLNLSIRKLLLLTSLLAVTAILTLAAVALYSNYQVRQQQLALIAASNVQAATQGMHEALGALGSRVIRLSGLRSSDEFATLPPRNLIENDYAMHRAGLGESAAALPGAEAALSDLDAAYGRFLAADDTVMAHTRSIIEAREQGNLLGGEAQTRIDAVLLVAEEIADKVARGNRQRQNSVRIMLAKSDMVGSNNGYAGIRGAIGAIIGGGASRALEASNEIRVAALRLALIVSATQAVDSTESLHQLHGEQAMPVFQRTRGLLDTLAATLGDEAELTAAAAALRLSIDELMASVFQATPSVFTLRGDVLELEQKLADALTSNSDSRQRVTTALGALDTLADERRMALIETSSDIMRRSELSVLAVGGLAVFLMVLGCGIAVRRVILPLREITAALDDIAAGDGDLNRRLPPSRMVETREVSTAFNRFADKVHRLVVDVDSATHELSGAVAQSATLASDSHARIDRQRLDTDEMATAASQLSAGVQEVARSAERAAEAAASATRETDNGKQVIIDSRAAIEALAARVSTVAGDLQKLREDSEAVDKVVEVIRAISEQTNLLALNAAIEAARAGEQGRGFAVVADEVRTLASRTRDSTVEIQGIVERLQNRARDAGKAMLAGDEQAASSVGAARAAEQALDRIAEAVATISQMNLQIAAGSEEQSRVTAEIDRRILAINDNARETADGANTAAAACGDMERLATRLESMVGQFRL